MPQHLAAPVRVSLASRASTLTEYMDDPNCDPRALRRSYAGFRVVNPVVSGWRHTYRRLIRPLLSASEPRTLLDIGSGGGDVPRSLARWATRDGLLLDVTAIDPNPRAYEYATSQPAMPGVRFRLAYSAELVAEGARFHFVTSNHILHHLSEQELRGVIADTETLCTVLAAHSDIARSRFAYTGFSLATLPFFAGSYIRHDGLASIRRSYTVPELRAALPARWRVIPQSPSRLLATWSPDVADR
ncbi:class I SAM-dependent methyltransferase [Salinibacterium sp. ZJ454]|uniref:class I SAM-dependent methyltransferase n=1 Tax=Salinibacterium sp. ZJ454 TaxID=2708339 RepID=UPI0014218A8C|nr:class I SAM-dependent methyltransferase [Salinibacterium sp. ZJ454]